MSPLKTYVPRCPHRLANGSGEDITLETGPEPFPHALHGTPTKKALIGKTLAVNTRETFRFIAVVFEEVVRKAVVHNPEHSSAIIYAEEPLVSDLEAVQGIATSIARRCKPPKLSKYEDREQNQRTTVHLI
eukprot:4323876-Amphidinium_carterae.1